MLAFLAVARGFLSKVPLWFFTAAAVFIAGFLFGIHEGASKLEAFKTEQAAVVAKLKTQASAITTVEVTKYVDRVQVVREAGQTITKKVNVYVPRNVCILPAGFTSLHDAAATGRVLPDTPGDSHAAPVDAQDVAATVSENYTTARLNAEQLIALQNWIRAQQKGSNGTLNK